MEFANVGSHCSMQHCGQQDILPFKCDLCNNVYCSNHRRPKDHDCKNIDIDDNQVMLCPICHSSLGKLKDRS